MPSHPALRHHTPKLRPPPGSLGPATPVFVIPPASRARTCNRSCFLLVTRWLVRQDVVRTTPSPTPPSLCFAAPGPDNSGVLIPKKTVVLLTRSTCLQRNFRVHQLPGGEGSQVHRRHTRQWYVGSLPHQAHHPLAGSAGTDRCFHLRKTRTLSESTSTDFGC
jgi:hypothetical protein